MLLISVWKCMENQICVSKANYAIPKLHVPSIYRFKNLKDVLFHKGVYCNL